MSSDRRATLLAQLIEAREKQLNEIERGEELLELLQQNYFDGEDNIDDIVNMLKITRRVYNNYDETDQRIKVLEYRSIALNRLYARYNVCPEIAAFVVEVDKEYGIYGWRKAFPVADAICDAYEATKLK